MAFDDHIFNRFYRIFWTIFLGKIFFKLYTHYSIIRGFKSEETMTDFSFLAKLFLNLKRQRTPCLKRVHKSKRTYRLRATIEM